MRSTMKVRVSIDEIACIALLRQACYHNGHCHNELWSFGLRHILGRAISLRNTEPMEFEVVGYSDQELKP